jgi:flagellar motor protein MotB
VIESLPGSDVGRSQGWVISYGDLMSLLVVFFVLFFAIAPQRPAIESERTAQRRQDVVFGALATRGASATGGWERAGRIRFQPGSTLASPAEARRLEEEVIPRLHGTGQTIVIVARGGATEVKVSSEELLQARAAAVATCLEEEGIDPARLLALWGHSREESAPGAEAQAGVDIFLAPEVRME